MSGKSEDSPLVARLRFVDESLTSKLSLAATPSSPLGYLRPHFKCLEISCHGIPWFTGCIVFMWLVHDQATQVLLCNLLMALLLDIVAVAVIKALTRRRRPLNNTSDMFLTMSVDKLSFPSGHTSRSVMLSYIFRYQCEISPLLGAFVVSWCIVVCVSRVLMGRHHVADVLGGVVLGFLEFYLVQLLWMEPKTALFLARTFFSIAD